MADTKLDDIASGAPAAATDIIYAVKDPAGTPADAKLTLGEVIDLIEASANTFTANQTFSAQATLPLQTLTDGATIDWNCNSGAKAKVTLGGNRTINAVTNAIEGTSYTLWVIQDGTGSRTLTFTTSGAGSFDFGADGAPTLTTTADEADVLGFEAISIDGTLKLRFVGIKKGFA
jgi:hypothetical protein